MKFGTGTLVVKQASTIFKTILRSKGQRMMSPSLIKYRHEMINRWLFKLGGNVSRIQYHTLRTFTVKKSCSRVVNGQSCEHDLVSTLTDYATTINFNSHIINYQDQEIPQINVIFKLQMVAYCIGQWGHISSHLLNE